MKKNIHPLVKKIKVKCSTCGTSFDLHSVADNIEIDICSKCHPYYSGNTQSIRATGRVERFNKKLQKMQAKNPK